jgi:hypothetical protein
VPPPLSKGGAKSEGAGKSSAPAPAPNTEPDDDAATAAAAASGELAATTSPGAIVFAPESSAGIAAVIGNGGALVLAVGRATEVSRAPAATAGEHVLLRYLSDTGVAETLAEVAERVFSTPISAGLVLVPPYNHAARLCVMASTRLLCWPRSLAAMVAELLPPQILGTSDRREQSAVDPTAPAALRTALLRRSSGLWVADQEKLVFGLSSTLLGVHGTGVRTLLQWLQPLCNASPVAVPPPSNLRVVSSLVGPAVLFGSLLQHIHTIDLVEEYFFEVGVTGVCAEIIVKLFYVRVHNAMTP